MTNFQIFDDRSSASLAAAQRLAYAVRQQLEVYETALLAVSGGTTPKECFNRLSDMRLPWQRVDVTTTDERCVSPDDPERNDRMVREHLLRGLAARARLIALDQIPESPFAAVLLGMGADGHFASLFPDAENLAEGLDLTEATQSVSIETSASPYKRKSLTLGRLLRTSSLSLLVFGEDKRQIIESCQDEKSLDLPISHVLLQDVVPVHVFWAP